ncbi:nicotinic acid mononucleotide adenyltransferase [Spongiivirga sp. MCCC 1A20706]|uniref:toxin-antitoxin system YwqK family antitoxin n=1 Tax=Spongiivirga sp. MCCC 1A20706 TaxID=3160963 RepID=UPI003977818E
MKKIIAIIALVSVTFSFAQEKKTLTLNKETNLIEAKLYHDNGVMSQEGTYNLAGKLEGAWTSYNEFGKKTAVGEYTNGVKTGKWFFWSDNTLKEVDYTDNRIVNVSLWTNKKQVVAVRD